MRTLSAKRMVSRDGYAALLQTLMLVRKGLASKRIKDQTLITMSGGHAVMESLSSVVDAALLKNGIVFPKPPPSGGNLRGSSRKNSGANTRPKGTPNRRAK